MRIKITDKSPKVPSTGANSISTAVSVMNKQLAQWAAVWYQPDHQVFANPSTFDWEIIVVDDADQADALGYHTTSPAGKPYGKVFINVCQQYNLPWISVLSHEVLELVGDPGANQWANDDTGQLWAYEMCDVVQDHLYNIDGVPVSNFVYPNFFIPGAPPPYDHMRKLQAPFTINKGYSVVGKVTQVKNIFAFRKPASMSATSILGDAELVDRPDKRHPASRTQRRLHTFG